MWKTGTLSYEEFENDLLDFLERARKVGDPWNLEISKVQFFLKLNPSLNGAFASTTRPTLYRSRFNPAVLSICRLITLLFMVKFNSSNIPLQSGKFRTSSRWKDRLDLQTYRQKDRPPHRIFRFHTMRRARSHAFPRQRMLYAKEC